MQNLEKLGSLGLQNTKISGGKERGYCVTHERWGLRFCLNYSNLQESKLKSSKLLGENIMEGCLLMKADEINKKEG